MTMVDELTDDTARVLAPLFEPITLGNVQIRNRVVMTGHGTGMAKDYLPTEQHVAYYRERAIGGAGLIGMAFPQIHPTSQDVPGEPRAWLPEIVPGLRRISAAVHEHGARIVMQLGHGGRQGHSTFTERALWGPSNTPCPFNLEMPKEMESEDIEEIIEAHAIGARHAKQGGMDGVEIHSGYGGYLLASFLSPFSNHRTDEYGGSLENRMRIVLRVIDAVRAEVGPDYLVGMNLQGHDFSPGGLEVGDAQQIAAAVAATGKIDYLCVKAATYNEAHQNVPDMQHPKRIWESLAAAVKEVVDVPVIAVGRINDPLDAADILSLGHADMVAMTRQQIADPETVNKMKAGRLDEIRRCIGCNQGCIDRLFNVTHSSCVHNPAAGYELELGIGTLVQATLRRRVVVIGAGPAGMKAAETAARQGHEVILIERRNRTGGQLRIAAKIKGRAEIGGVIDHLDVMIGKHGVDLRLGWSPTADEILALDPDHIIVATGSAPAADIVGNLAQGITHTPGLDQPHVLSVWDVLDEDKPVGHHVAIVDDGEGGWKGIGLALQLQADGHQVEFLTPLPYVGAKLGPFSANLAVPRILESGMSTHPFTTMTAVDGPTLRIVEKGATGTLEGIDTVILAGWHRPVTELYFALKNRGVTVERVGDAVASRTMMEAVHEGERAARRVPATR
ncbi:FAD-dependent oxidoreductase [Mycolicibacterium brisbanense]|uniref:NADH, flavin oxidoreductase/NADH oxidase n=1 Tax=Mycolicibacterium brisbanense TaxID=146020 RepID=A0A100W155_9MYCO|nr:FAD-dependent oxidoreductase [Mycolicibacterium brisbanense]MCV7160104.1 FAD-dependent oxidoreductase [Mycolicibacterium brisbanense]GAS89714.1 NADH, flavin oxidoreductase/NADH oxidase [Mycolicibacterium brisbanense]